LDELKGGTMKTLRTILIALVLLGIAFGGGYAVGYLKLKNAEKEWTAARQQMQGKIGTLEKELARANAREALREIPDSLGQVAIHITDKNFGLAKKTLEGIKEAFGGVQGYLDEEMKKKFEFFLPALAELQKEADQVNPDTRRKAEELGVLFERTLKTNRKTEPSRKG
jgi:hypothetical protein